MVAGPLHRRPDRHAGDARPDPRRDRPVMAIDPSQVRRFAHGSRVPGWDEAADLTKDPAVVPDPATTPVPGRPPRARSRPQMAKYPDIRSAAIPALHIVQREHGWCSPTAIEQAACVMRLTPAYLTAVATFYDMFDTVPDGAHTTSTCARTSRARCAAPTSSTTRCSPPPATTRASTCGRSSAWARATSRRWRRSTASTSARSSRDDCQHDRRRRLEGRPRGAADKQLKRRKIAVEHWKDRC